MILTPLCPLCSQPPEMILDDGHQAFCGTDGCPAFTWDTHLDIDTLMARAAPVTVTEDPVVVVINGQPVTEAELDAAIWQVVEEREADG